MLIDWFTVLAQVTNFLILIFLLKRFLYEPILNAIDKREELIAKRISDAKEMEDEAKMIGKALKDKIEDYDKHSTDRERELNEKLKLESERMREKARIAAVKLSEKWHKNLEEEAFHLNQVIVKRTQSEVIALTRKTLSDLAGTELEDRMIEVFVKRLKGMDQNRRENLKSILQASQNKITINSSFEISNTQIETIKSTVTKLVNTQIEVQVEVVQNLTSGIELIMNGQKIAWSIENYLVSVEERFQKTLQDNIKGKIG